MHGSAPPPPPPAHAGAPRRVYVKYEGSGEAARCIDMMDGRMFDDRKVGLPRTHTHARLGSTRRRALRHNMHIALGSRIPLCSPPARCLRRPGNKKRLGDQSRLHNTRP